MIGACQDITELKQRERLLQMTTEKLNEAQEVAKMGVFEIELENRKIWWSKGMYSIFEIDPNLPSPDLDDFLKIIHPEDIVYTNELIAQCIKKRVSNRMLFQNLISNAIKFRKKRRIALYGFRL